MNTKHVFIWFSNEEVNNKKEAAMWIEGKIRKDKVYGNCVFIWFQMEMLIKQ